MSGKLYLVPTPIGNLKDITFRAIEALQSVDLILAEDTRTSRVLLNHYEIQTPLQSYHIHNEHKVVDSIIDLISEGKNVALISDAGSPGISDPGYLIAKNCVDNQINLEALPGATALIPAISISGIPSNEFVFFGFLPVKKGRKSKLESLKNEKRTMIFYESPHKIKTTIKDFIAFFGEERNASLSRELTKKFEETIRGNLLEIYTELERKARKGEMVLVVEGKKS